MRVEHWAVVLGVAVGVAGFPGDVGEKHAAPRLGNGGQRRGRPERRVRSRGRLVEAGAGARFDLDVG